MPYDPQLAERIRTRLADAPQLVEKKMFGGIGWTIRGNMACGAHNDGRLMIRCSREDTPTLADLPGASAMERNGKPMAGWILVDGEAVAEDEALDTWVGRGRSFASALPPKKKS